MQDTPQEEADPVTPPRKRRGNPAEWKANKAKKANNAGKEYVSARGKSVPAKKFGRGCGPKCRKKCSVVFTYDQRQKIFEGFWKLGDPSLRWQYIAGRVTSSSVKRRTVDVLDETSRSRNLTNNYTLLLKKNLYLCVKKCF